MTNEEKKKIYQQLAAPFPEEAIERTDGKQTGRGYNTTGIKYQFAVNRLNEVLGIGGWRVHRTLRTKELKTQAGRTVFQTLAEVTIELGTWIDGTFVAWADAVADGGHTSTDESSSVKGAYGNAIKKCAAFFGCGRQAYEGTLDDDNAPAESTFEQPQGVVTVTTMPTQRQQAPASNAPSVLQASRPAAPSRNRLTSKQLAAIWAIGRKAGFEQGSLRGHIKTTFGMQPEFLTREQASQAIGALSQHAGNGHAEEFQAHDVRQDG